MNIERTHSLTAEEVEVLAKPKRRKISNEKKLQVVREADSCKAPGELGALLRTIYGIGPILSLVILYEIHDINRFPRVQDFVSYARLVKCAKESAGKRRGTSGKKIGNAHLKWAFSEAAVLFLRGNPEGMRYKKRLEKKHGKSKALSLLAHKLGRAAYYMLKRQKAFDMKKFLKS